MAKYHLEPKSCIYCDGKPILNEMAAMHMEFNLSEPDQYSADEKPWLPFSVNGVQMDLKESTIGTDMQGKTNLSQVYECKGSCLKVIFTWPCKPDIAKALVFNFSADFDTDTSGSDTNLSDESGEELEDEGEEGDESDDTCIVHCPDSRQEKRKNKNEESGTVEKKSTLKQSKTPIAEKKQENQRLVPENATAEVKQPKQTKVTLKPKPVITSQPSSESQTKPSLASKAKPAAVSQTKPVVTSKQSIYSRTKPSVASQPKTVGASQTKPEVRSRTKPDGTSQTKHVLNNEESHLTSTDSIVEACDEAGDEAVDEAGDEAGDETQSSSDSIRKSRINEAKAGIKRARKDLAKSQEKSMKSQKANNKSLLIVNSAKKIEEESAAALDVLRKITNSEVKKRKLDPSPTRETVSDEENEDVDIMSHISSEKKINTKKAAAELKEETKVAKKRKHQESADSVGKSQRKTGRKKEKEEEVKKEQEEEEEDDEQEEKNNEEEENSSDQKKASQPGYKRSRQIDQAYCKIKEVCVDLLKSTPVARTKLNFLAFFFDKNCEVTSETEIGIPRIPKLNIAGDGSFCVASNKSKNRAIDVSANIYFRQLFLSVEKYVGIKQAMVLISFKHLKVGFFPIKIGSEGKSSVFYNPNAFTVTLQVCESKITEKSKEECEKNFSVVPCKSGRMFIFSQECEIAIAPDFSAKEGHLVFFTDADIPTVARSRKKKVSIFFFFFFFVCLFFSFAKRREKEYDKTHVISFCFPF